MTAKEYLETKTRMTKECVINCEDCPLGNNNNGMGRRCDTLEREYADKAIAIVQKWGEEYPVKTLLDKFFEVFPNASKDKRGTPLVICPRQFGYKDDGCCVSNEDCLECWSQAYVEVEK